MTREFNALGAFIYAGGFTLGMRNHFNILAHFEDGDFGVDTVRYNLPQIPVYTDPDEWPVDEYRGRCDVVYSNPPCAPWSSANVTGGATPENTTDHRLAFQLIDQLQPDVWVWESVTGAYTGKDDWLSQWTTGQAMERDYGVYHFLHDVKFMGLPQQRRRCFTIASRVRIDFALPDAEIVYPADVVDSVDEPGGFDNWGKHMETIKYTEPGESMRVGHERRHGEGTPGGPSFLSWRLGYGRLAGTVIGGNHIAHHREDRPLGVNEQKALQGFPKWYEFQGRIESQFDQMGKTVTPVAGDYLGQQLRAALERNYRFSEPEEWEVDYMATSNRIKNLDMKSEVRRLR